ncbi:hypothetical protein H0O02_02295 [Candidatus Micrarchaeota archaeon]|nr:hypothetical protein [Candidatus Micrarchaeota archaeon]
MPEDPLLVEYLEESAAFLSQKKKRLRELSREYREVYDKQIREEMEQVRSGIRRKKTEIVETLYENVDELRHLKKYFPELLEIFMEDESIGAIMRKKSFLFENLKQLGDKEAREKLNIIRMERRQLRDAKKFLHRWTGTISGKQLGATYTILKDAVKGTVDKEEAEEIVGRADAEKRKKGWMVLINSQLAAGPLNALLGKKRMLELAVVEKTKAYEAAKGRGTSAEYSAKKNLEALGSEKSHAEKMIKHILLTNPDFVSALKKSKGWSLGKKDPMKEIAEGIPIRRIREKVWLERMRKRIS